MQIWLKRCIVAMLIGVLGGALAGGCGNEGTEGSTTGTEESPPASVGNAAAGATTAPGTANTAGGAGTKADGASKMSGNPPFGPGKTRPANPPSYSAPAGNAAQ